MSEVILYIVCDKLSICAFIASWLYIKEKYRLDKCNKLLAHMHCILQTKWARKVNSNSYYQTIHFCKTISKTHRGILYNVLFMYNLNHAMFLCFLCIYNKQFRRSNCLKSTDDRDSVQWIHASSEFIMLPSMILFSSVQNKLSKHYMVLDNCTFIPENKPVSKHATGSITDEISYTIFWNIMTMLFRGDRTSK